MCVFRIILTAFTAWRGPAAQLLCGVGGRGGRGDRRRYDAVPGPLGERLRSELKVDEEGDFCFPLHGGRCPFLDEENLCEIHRCLGQEATSLTCREHPRFAEEYGPFREISLSASCPAASAAAGSREPLDFLERETPEPEGGGEIRGLQGFFPCGNACCRFSGTGPAP